MASKYKQYIRQNIRKYRKEKGYTQLYLGLECSYNSEYISQIERGVCTPSIDGLLKIAKALDVEPSKFFIKP